MNQLEFPYLAVIPHSVLSDKTITPNAKIYFGCLAGLAKKEGYCWASDEQLSHLFEVSERQIHRWNALLEKKGYIKRETKSIPHKNEDGVFFWTKERKIYVSEGFSRKVCESDKNVMIDHDKNVMSLEHDKNVTNKDINLLSIKKENIYKRKFGKFVELQEEEYQKFCKDLGKEETDQLIEEVNDYCSNHKSYKDYAAAIRTFHRHKLDGNKGKFPKNMSVEVLNRKYTDSLKKLNKTLFDLRILYEAKDYFEINDGKSQLFLKYTEFGFNEQVENWCRKAKITLIKPQNLNI